MVMVPDKELFKSTINGRETSLHVLRNSNNLEVALTNYGARIVSLITSDHKGLPVDIVTGFDSIGNYLDATETFHGAIVGRYANRIARGRFSLDSRQYQLAINNPPNHLHGGPNGFHQQVWDIEEASASTLRLSYFSKDGEEHYPGNVKVDLVYTLNETNELSLYYKAQTDQPTIVNLTSHPFFNLNGQGTGTILDHTLQIDADLYNPVDQYLIPTGIEPVDQTPLDFRKSMRIGKRIGEPHPQIQYGGGYDHNFVLNGKGFRPVGRVTGDRSGITMEVLTDQPGMQLYSGNFMKGDNRIKYGLRDDFRNAFCLETQHFPDSPNHPDFPSTVLEPGEIFTSTTVYKFSTEPVTGNR
jgi:aldose 1-epimerase